VTAPAMRRGRLGRPSIRWRLTAWYACIFLVLGATLLSLSYVLVSRNLGPDANPTQIVYRGGGPGAAVSNGGSIGTERVSPDDAVVRRARRAFEAAQRERARRGLRRVLTGFLLALGGLTVTSLAAGWLVAGRVLAPIDRITSTARRVSREHLHERIALGGPQDELKELADTFDDMLGRLDAAFDSQRRFVANASHELRTPLAVIRAELDEAVEDPASSPDVRGLARQLQRPTERSERLIASLLTLAHSETPVRNPAQVDVGQVTRIAADGLLARAARERIHLRLAVPRTVVCGDHLLIEHMVRNVLENAVRYNHAGGWVEASVTCLDGEARIVVANTGPAVAPGRLDELWQPFRRLEPSRSHSNGGLGLGLSIVRAVAEAHGGHVVAHARPAGGLVVEIGLPAHPLPGPVDGPTGAGEA
jgi:signal transduction histidine kinase